MAGFAVLIAPDSSPEALESDFINLLRLTARYKQVESPFSQARGTNCMAVKLDTPASIHTGIVRDEATGSWLLASGTVVALEGDNHPTKALFRLLRGYIDYGLKALEVYDGHFALAIFNGKDNSISVISDPIGMFATFYCRRGSQVLISSSALALATQTQSKPDILAIEHFLRTGRLDADKTLWQDVKRLPAGTILKATNGRVELNEYWTPTYDHSISHLPIGEALDECVRLLNHAFSRCLQREGKVWVDLTGGFDTRLVATLTEKTRVPFCVYCTGPVDHPDVQLSRQISKEMRWEYVHTQLPEEWEAANHSWFTSALGCGDGRASVLRLAMVLRSFEERNATIKTNVMGVGGENFRGYNWQIERGNIGRTTHVNYEAWLNTIIPGIPLEIMRYDRSKEVRQELYNFFIQLCSKYSTMPNTVQIDRFELGRDAGHGGAYLSAVASTERSLAPLVFKATVNFAFSLNFRWKYPNHHIFVRAMLERENKRLANIPTTTGGPAVPLRITNIHRFWPLWKSMINRGVAIGSHRFMGRSLQIWPLTKQPGYPLPSWQTAFHTYASTEGMLNHNTMRSAGLYKPHEFKMFVENATRDQQTNSEFLDRVISVEMALRATGSSVD